MTARTGGRESGQSHIAAMCVALPLFLSAALFVVQVCWIAYQTIAFDYALCQSAWSIGYDDLGDLRTPTGAERYVRSAIAAAWPYIDPDDLDIEEATCSVAAETTSRALASPIDRNLLRIERAAQTTTTARVTATATLRVKLLLPIAGSHDLSIVRAIDKTRQVSTRFEVS